MKVLAAVLLSVILMSSGFIINSPAIAEPNEKANDRAKQVYKLPTNAVEIAPGIYYIGSTIHEGQVVDGYLAFEHNGRNHPGGGPGGGGSGGNGDDVSECYSYTFKKAKWKTVENYIVDSTNVDGLSDSFVNNVISGAIDKWETAAGTDIIGSKTNGVVDGADFSSPDNKNEVMFREIADDGVLAFANVWMTRVGQQLIEFDMVFDESLVFDVLDENGNLVEKDFAWGDAGPTSETELGNTDVFDFDTVTTHEIGHAMNMGHTQGDNCSEETMYPSTTAGSTKERTLHDGDIAGITNLY